MNYVRYGFGFLRSVISSQQRLSHAALYLTHRCNLRCIYCASPYQKTSELTLAEWCRVLAQLRDLGCRRILLLGGEPLVRTDFDQVIDRAKSLGMRCVLTSNGLLVPRYIDRLRHLDTLVLSLDGVGAANDAGRGKGVFDSVVKAIASARAAGIPTKLNAVMTRDSAPAFEQLLEFTEQQDLSLTVNVVRTGNPLWHHADAVSQEDADIRELLDKLARVARRNPRMLFSPHSYEFAATWPDFTIDRLTKKDLDSTDLAGQPRCHAGRAYLSIGPDGSTFPCATTANRIAGGNVVEDGVEKAWRKLHHHDCAACSSPCMIEQNYLFSGKPRVIARFAKNHLRRFS